VIQDRRARLAAFVCVWLSVVAGRAAAEAPSRWQSVWPKDHFVNQVPNNPEMMKIFEGQFERDEVRVQTQLGSEVRPFWYARGRAAAPTDRVLIYLHGDVPFRERNDTKFYRAFTTKRLPAFAKLAASSNTDIITLIRPGYFMAPGDTLFRRAPTTNDTMAAAITQIIQKFGYKSVALVGQSGGAMIAAAMMMQPEPTPRCVVLASGSHYQAIKRTGQAAKRLVRKAGAKRTPTLRELRQQEFDALSFEIGSNLDRVRLDPVRRVFVLADRQDSIVPFAGQPVFVAEMAKLSHHAVLMELQARGAQHHGLTNEGVEVGLRCLNGETDQEIMAAPLKSSPTAKPNDSKSNEKRRPEDRPSQF
jgi:pimeloyl-ACP methyl ester carboxylesterase